MRVKTYKHANGKWYVEAADDMDNEEIYAGDQLDASNSIDQAVFVSPSSHCGFESRKTAREYLRAYACDFDDVKITGGLH